MGKLTNYFYSDSGHDIYLFSTRVCMMRDEIIKNETLLQPRYCSIISSNCLSLQFQQSKEIFHLNELHEMFKQ